MKIRALALSLPVAFAALMLGGVSAEAGDAKVYPGSACVRYSGASPSYNFSGIFNPSTNANMFLDCIAVHDAGSINAAWMKVKDLNPSAGVRCQLYSLYANGNGGFSGWWSPAQATSNAGISTFWQTLNFRSVGSNGNSHHYFSCRVPPDAGSGRSGIANYKIDEN